MTVIESRIPGKGWTTNRVASPVVKPYSLVFVVDAHKRKVRGPPLFELLAAADIRSQVLLGLKKRGFGVGMWVRMRFPG